MRNSFKKANIGDIFFRESQLLSEGKKVAWEYLKVNEEEMLVRTLDEEKENPNIYNIKVFAETLDKDDIFFNIKSHLFDKDMETLLK